MKVVIDANVVVSALISQRDAPKLIIDRWREEAFELVVSESILSEIERVLHYPKIAALHRLNESELQEFLTLLRDESHLVAPRDKLNVSPDETDNRYLECALTGEAEYIVTGDKQHLLPIAEYSGIRIVSPATFLTLLQVDSLRNNEFNTDGHGFQGRTRMKAFPCSSVPSVTIRVEIIPSATPD